VNGLFPGVFTPYHSEHPHDRFVIATPSCYIPVPTTALSSLSPLTSIPSSPPSLPAPLPVPIPTLLIFTQAQNPRVVHQPLLQDKEIPHSCHSHICSCDDYTIPVERVTRRVKNQCSGCSQLGHFKKDCEFSHTMCPRGEQCKVPKTHRHYNQGVGCASSLPKGT
jgi:hypothetical protein